MFKLFKKSKKQSKADKRLAELGFVRSHEDDRYVVYTRHNKDYDYDHIITIHKRKDDVVRITSYDKGLFARNAEGVPIGNCAVALTPEEVKAIMRKIKEKRW